MANIYIYIYMEWIEWLDLNELNGLNWMDWMVNIVNIAHIASVRFEHSVCHGSLMTTYIMLLA